MPLATFVQQKRKTTPRDSQSKKSKTGFIWFDGDLQSNFPPWQHVVGCKNQTAPVEYFNYFFDDEVVQMLVDFSNKYATEKNRNGNITYDEMIYFFRILILSGYNTLFVMRSQGTRFRLLCLTYIAMTIQILDQSDKFWKMRPSFSALNKNIKNMPQQSRIIVSMKQWYPTLVDTIANNL